MHISGIGIGNDVGATIFFGFLALGVVIAFYLMFVRKDERSGSDKH
ncbi:MAG: hypothetical protein ACREKE_07510 [bacterium]